MKFRKYTHRDFEEVLVLLIEDFSEYPLYKMVKGEFSSNADYMRFVRFMLAAFLRVQAKYNHIILGVEDGKIISTAIIASPHDEEPKDADFLLSVGLSTYLPVPLKEVMSFREMMIRSEDYLYTLDYEEHHHLYMFAVKREYRHKGAGKYFMTKCVLPYVRSHGGKYISLATNTTENVSFYLHCGYELLHEDDVHYHGKTVKNWCLGMEVISD